MMGETQIRQDERVGLTVAVLLHAALLLVLLLQPSGRGEIPMPERMTVNLAEDIGLEAASPQPVPESRAAIAPELSDSPAPSPEADAPDRTELDRPTPQARPTAAASDTRPRRRPDPPRSQEQQQASERRGGSRLGDNFLEGAGDSARTDETRIPASQIGASAKASLFQAVARQLKPHWKPPSGPDVDLIVTKIRFRLNPDGSLSGRPSVVGQRGVNATNRAQSGRHGEQAVRAVQLAAPFDLPEEYYEGWKLITVDFDWKLAQ